MLCLPPRFFQILILTAVSASVAPWPAPLHDLQNTRRAPLWPPNKNFRLACNLAVDVTADNNEIIALMGDNDYLITGGPLGRTTNRNMSMWNVGQSSCSPNTNISISSNSFNNVNVINPVWTLASAHPIGLNTEGTVLFADMRSNDKKYYYVQAYNISTGALVWNVTFGTATTGWKTVLSDDYMYLYTDPGNVRVSSILVSIFSVGAHGTAQPRFSGVSVKFNASGINTAVITQQGDLLITATSFKDNIFSSNIVRINRNGEMAEEYYIINQDLGAYSQRYSYFYTCSHGNGHQFVARRFTDLKIVWGNYKIGCGFGWVVDDLHGFIYTYDDTSSSIVALSQETGKMAWEINLGSPKQTSLTLLTGSADAVLVTMNVQQSGADQNTFFALDPMSGGILWTSTDAWINAVVAGFNHVVSRMASATADKHIVAASSVVLSVWAA